MEANNREETTLIKVQFVARCAEQNIPLEVTMEFRPGDSAQRARRLAVGELLAVLEIEHATVDASGDDLATVTTQDGTWVIAEGRAAGEQRGTV